jgi:prevent-host-death family protein
MRVTMAEFIKGYGALVDQALTETVTITKNGRDYLVLISAEEHERLRRRDRRAVLPEELSEEEVAAIGAAEVRPGHEYLNEEARDWQA